MVDIHPALNHKYSSSSDHSSTTQHLMVNSAATAAAVAAAASFMPPQQTNGGSGGVGAKLQLDQEPCPICGDKVSRHIHGCRKHVCSSPHLYSTNQLWQHPVVYPICILGRVPDNIFRFKSGFYPNVPSILGIWLSLRGAHMRIVQRLL